MKISISKIRTAGARTLIVIARIIATLALVGALPFLTTATLLVGAAEGNLKHAIRVAPRASLELLLAAWE